MDLGAVNLVSRQSDEAKDVLMAQVLGDVDRVHMVPANQFFSAVYG
jgi:hypothetical protein